MVELWYFTYEIFLAWSFKLPGIDIVILIDHEVDHELWPTF